MAMKKVRRVQDNVVTIPSQDCTLGFGRLVYEPFFAFYNLKSVEILPLTTILTAPVAFKVCVRNYAVKSGIWPVTGKALLTPDLLEEPLFWKRDPMNDRLAIYRGSTSEEIPATQEECANLEWAAVWDLDHVVERLKAHFAGRPYDLFA